MAVFSNTRVIALFVVAWLPVNVFEICDIKARHFEAVLELSFVLYDMYVAF